MHDGIKLISKPSKPQICQLICAVTQRDLDAVVRYSCYRIENYTGKQWDIYARSDEDFYKKLIRNRWNKREVTTNPRLF